MNNPTHDNRSRKCFYVFAIVVAFVMTGRYVWTTGHRAALSTQCHCRIFELASAIYLYEAQYGTLPPRVVYKDGVPMHSWRVLLLESTDRQLFNEYRLDEPWNSPHNLSLADRRPAVYACPEISDPDEPFHTSYTAVISPRPLLRDGQTLKSIRDPENVLMIVETKRTDIHWMSPEDISIEDLSSDVLLHDIIGGHHEDGGKAAVVTGEIVPVGDLTLADFVKKCSVPVPVPSRSR